MKPVRLISLLLALQILWCPVSALEISPPGMVEAETAPTSLGLDATQALLPEEALDLDGEALMLYELTTGTLVYGKGLDDLREPASVTKLMTCLLALKYGALEDQVPVTASALSGMTAASSSAGLQAGETYTLEQLLYCLMVQSANDAALVIAEYIGGSQEAFAEMMNAEARALGCTGSHFTNPHGLHDEDHYTTARDLAKILMADLEYGFFHTLYSTTSYVLPATGDREERTLRTTNYLLDTAVNDQYYDARVLGGKTGFTTPAGRCVVLTAASGDLIYLAVVLGASGYDAAGQEIYGSFTTASELLDAGFGWFGVQTVAAAEEAIPVRVKNGGNSSLIPMEPISALLPLSYDSADLRTIPPEVQAPLYAGADAGTLQITYRGALVAAGAVCASEDVAYQKASGDAKRSRPSLPPEIHLPWNRWLSAA